MQAQEREPMDEKQQELIERLQAEFGDHTTEDALDDLVIDEALSIASGVNNSGIEGQIEWLVEHGYGEDDIRAMFAGNA